jgi:hypothetical protein
MVFLRRQVEVSKAAVTEVCRQGRVPAHQFGRSETVLLGLQDMIVVDRADLADGTVNGADEIGRCEQTRPDLQGACEEIIEALVAAEVRCSASAMLTSYFCTNQRIVER